jgi:hypothetical protein
MATYTGTTKAKRGIGRTIWFAVAAFAVATAVVIAVMTMRSDSSPPASSGTGQVQTQTDRTNGGICANEERHGWIAAQCAP